MTVRYLEVDGQGVVFHMWYLAWFDDALVGFFADEGMAYPDLLAAGLDTQIVHTELDYRAGVRWGDAVLVEVSTAAVGRTSLTVAFRVLRGDDADPVVTGRTVYVFVATDGSGSRPVPERLRGNLSA